MESEISRPAGEGRNQSRGALLPARIGGKLVESGYDDGRDTIRRWGGCILNRLRAGWKKAFLVAPGSCRIEKPSAFGLSVLRPYPIHQSLAPLQPLTLAGDLVGIDRGCGDLDL